MLGTVEGFVDRLAELSPYARVDDAATAARVGQPRTWAKVHLAGGIRVPYSEGMN